MDVPDDVDVLDDLDLPDFLDVPDALKLYLTLSACFLRSFSRIRLLSRKWKYF
jgi:hypothetical protein